MPDRRDIDDEETFCTAYGLGYEEGLGDVGMTYDDDPDSPLSRCYDAGRTVRRVLADWETYPDEEE